MTVEEYAEKYGMTLEDAQEIFDQEERWKRASEDYYSSSGNDSYDGLTLAERNR